MPGIDNHTQVDDARKFLSTNYFAPRSDKEKLKQAAIANAEVREEDALTADYDVEKKIREEFFLEALNRLSPEDLAKTLRIYRNAKQAELLHDLRALVENKYKDSISEAEKERLVWELAQHTLLAKKEHTDPSLLDTLAKEGSRVKGSPALSALENTLDQLRPADPEDETTSSYQELAALVEQYRKKALAFEERFSKDQELLKQPSFDSLANASTTHKFAGKQDEFLGVQREYRDEAARLKQQLLDLDSSINLFATEAEDQARHNRRRERERYLAEHDAPKGEVLKSEEEALRDALLTEDLEDKIARRKKAIPFLDDQLEDFQRQRFKEEKTFTDTDKVLQELAIKKAQQRQEAHNSLTELIEKQQEYLKDKYLAFAKNVSAPSSMAEARRTGKHAYAQSLEAISRRKEEQSKAEYLKAITPWYISMHQNAHNNQRENLSDEMGVLDARLTNMENMRKRNTDYTNQHYGLLNLYNQEKGKAKVIQDSLFNSEEISRLQREKAAQEKLAINEKDQEKRNTAERALNYLNPTLANKLVENKEAQAAVAGLGAVNSMRDANFLRNAATDAFHRKEADLRYGLTNLVLAPTTAK